MFFGIEWLGKYESILDSIFSVNGHKYQIDISNELSSDRRSYAKVMTSGIRMFNLPPWGRKIYDGSSSRVMFWTFGVLSLILLL